MKKKDYKDALGHNYKAGKPVPATCMEEGYTTYTCTRCNDSYNDDYTGYDNCSYGSWISDNNGTADCDGTKTRTCSNCKQAETETIKATGHSYGSWSTTKNATCDANGTKTRKCSKCGNAETQTIPATGHNWDEGKMTTKPTNCSDMGVCTYTCLTCGKTKMTQVKGEHSFGSWKYEAYTYKDYNPDGSCYNTVSHRKVRSCTKCGYVEYGNTPDHHCYKGADTHKVTIVSEPTCSKRGVKRSTCTVCGWSTEFEYGETGNAHDWKKETKRLTEYTQYTDELDAVISTCRLCGKQSVSYKWGEGATDYHRYRIRISINEGTAYGASSNNPDWLSHPTWQTVRRDHVYDSDGYIKQFTVYWHDKSGNRYSQVIHCGKGEMEAWFAEFGMTHESPTSWKLIIQGGFIVPYKIGF
jgi:hypothetical protein